MTTPQDTICLRCNRPLSEHTQWTAEEVAATKGTGHPVSDSVIGQWRGHDPMPMREATA